MVFTRVASDVKVGANCNPDSIPLSGNATKVVHNKKSGMKNAQGIARAPSWECKTDISLN